MTVRRVVKVLSLVTTLSLASVGFANAHDIGGRGGTGYGNGGGWGDPAPELDPTILGSGLALLAGGVMLLNERRRIRK